MSDLKHFQILCDVASEHGYTTHGRGGGLQYILHRKVGNYSVYLVMRVETEAGRVGFFSAMPWRVWMDIFGPPFPDPIRLAKEKEVREMNRKYKDAASELPGMRQGKDRFLCPNCDSRRIYYRRGSRTYTCYRCGWEWDWLQGGYHWETRVTPD